MHLCWEAFLHQNDKNLCDRARSILQLHIPVIDGQQVAKLQQIAGYWTEADLADQTIQQGPQGLQGPLGLVQNKDHKVAWRSWCLTTLALASLRSVQFSSALLSLRRPRIRYLATLRILRSPQVLVGLLPDGPCLSRSLSGLISKRNQWWGIDCLSYGWINADCQQKPNL